MKTPLFLRLNFPYATKLSTSCLNNRVIGKRKL